MPQATAEPLTLSILVPAARARRPVRRIPVTTCEVNAERTLTANDEASINTSRVAHRMRPLLGLANSYPIGYMLMLS
jgi:hypothetical protein